MSKEALARKLVWWPDARPVSDRDILARVMVMGSWDDILEACRLWGDEAFAAVLDAPPSGLFDERSWVYWNKRLGRVPVPPLPPSAVPWPPR